MKVLFLERHMPAWRLLRPLVASCAGLLAACTHQPLPPPPETSTQVSVDPDGLVHVPAMLVPVSEYLSPEGKAYLIDHLLTMKNPELLKEVEGIGGPAFLKGYIDRQRELFAVQKSETEIGGVQVYDYTPSEGIKPENQNRVLIEILAAFPPTQIITGTRGFELSSAIYTHSRLVKLGVKADLHVWEGMFHGFYSNPDVPESQDAYKVMVDFFDEHLGN